MPVAEPCGAFWNLLYMLLPFPWSSCRNGSTCKKKAKNNIFFGNRVDMQSRYGNKFWLVSRHWHIGRWSSLCMTSAKVMSYIYTHAYACVFVCLRVYIHVHACVRICTYIYIYKWLNVEIINIYVTCTHRHTRIESCTYSTGSPCAHYTTGRMNTARNKTCVNNTISMDNTCT